MPERLGKRPRRHVASHPQRLDAALVYGLFAAWPARIARIDLFVGRNSEAYSANFFIRAAHYASLMRPTSISFDPLIDLRRKVGRQRQPKRLQRRSVGAHGELG